MYSLRNRHEKLAKGSLFCLFLKLVQINYIFTDNVRILYIYLTYNDRLTCTIGSAFFRISIPASQLEWMSFPKFKKNHFLHYVHCTCMYILQEIFFLALYDPRSDSLQTTAYYTEIALSVANVAICDFFSWLATEIGCWRFFCRLDFLV